MIKHPPTLKTGAEWARILRVPILEPTGWSKPEEYSTLPVSKLVFCNLAANSKLDTKEQLSRRDAKRYGHNKLAIGK
jgi:hypothetical protein